MTVITNPSAKEKNDNPTYGVKLSLRHQSVPQYAIKKAHIGQYARESVGKYQDRGGVTFFVLETDKDTPQVLQN